MKVGIMTFHYAHNYGAMLQAYALRRYLTTQEYETDIINYVPDYMRLKYFHVNPLRVFASCKRSVIKGYLRRRKNVKKFSEFEEKYLGIKSDKLLTKTELQDAAKSYDLLVFGSDQVWNTHITQEDTSYFGDFAKGKKKISYAASLGDATTSEGYSAIVKRYVSEYGAVSVREKSAQIYLNTLLEQNVDCVLDPVFLLSRNEWEKLANSVKISLKENYVIYYTIQDNKQLAEECNSYARKNGLKIYAIHGEMKKSNAAAKLLSGIGPIEFLALLKNADTVFTNSFHAAAFSIIFNKHAFLRVHTETGNRVVDLLSMCECNWSGNGIFEKKEDVYKNLISSISYSSEFLKNSLENVEIDK